MVRIIVKDFCRPQIECGFNRYSLGFFLMYLLVGTGFQPDVGSVTIIRRQMLSHFPTVTKSTGFQPEPLLITHHSPLIAESGTGFQQADIAITSSPETASLVTESIGFQPKP